jgi:hypothetical protein
MRTCAISSCCLLHFLVLRELRRGNGGGDDELEEEVTDTISSGSGVDELSGGRGASLTGGAKAGGITGMRCARRYPQEGADSGVNVIYTERADGQTHLVPHLEVAARALSPGLLLFRAGSPGFPWVSSSRLRRVANYVLACGGSSLVEIAAVSRVCMSSCSGGLEV